MTNRGNLVCRKVHKYLVPHGRFIFSVEHPVFTSTATQQWCLGPTGEVKHWPVDNYQQEGVRDSQWLEGHVLKYHRTMATYVNTLLEAGFRIRKLIEPEPLAEQLVKHPDWKDEGRRPMFLLVSATKTVTPD